MILIVSKQMKTPYTGSGPDRTYELTASGKTFDELVLSASISEVNDNGDSLCIYELDRAKAPVQAEALELFLDEVNHLCF